MRGKKEDIARDSTSDSASCYFVFLTLIDINL